MPDKGSVVSQTAPEVWTAIFEQVLLSSAQSGHDRSVEGQRELATLLRVCRRWKVRILLLDGIMTHNAT
jgi:hypothetical protein